MTRQRKIIIGVGAAAVLLLSAAGFFVFEVYFACPAVSPQTTTTGVFAIEKGQGFRDVGFALQ